MKKIIIQIFAILIILCVVVFEYYLRFSNIDMTDARWFVTFWYYHTLAIILATISGIMFSISDNINK